MTAKYKIKVINETILDLKTVDEAKKMADIFEDRASIGTFLGNITYTYTEIERQSDESRN